MRRFAVEDPGLRKIVTALEARVARLEDQLAIHRLINSWGPAVDAGQAEAAAALFSDDAVLTSDMSHLVGPLAIEEMVRSDGQQALIRQGSAHIPAFPLVDIDGDRARAIGYSRVYVHTDAGYEVWRVSANYWNFSRTENGWRVSSRTNHVIDGSSEARALLAGLFK
jgi:ketosteroid isomerase-like protein